MNKSYLSILTKLIHVNEQLQNKSMIGLIGIH